MGFYSKEGMRASRDQHETPPAAPQAQLAIFEQVPADAEYDDAPLTVWNGERFVAWDKWLAAVPIESIGPPDGGRPAIPPDAACVSAVCGGIRIWVAKDGERWLILVGSRRQACRRKDFASPSLAHAMSTAERWYGPPADGWRPEEQAGKGTHENAEEHVENLIDREADAYGEDDERRN